MKQADVISRTIVWERFEDHATIELMVLSRAAEGYRFDGHVLGAEQGRPLRVEYRIDCDPDWQTVACTIEQTFGEDATRLVLQRDSDTWSVNGTIDPALAECSDVDLGISPSTNTLPIRRLGLSIGERRDLRAAWVRFPDRRAHV